jgi:predicted nucleotidyltransferase
MVATKQIQEYAQKVVQEFQPERILLFGSHGRQTATADSDVDLLVVMQHRKRNVTQALEIDCRIHREFPLDLIVRTPAEVRRRLAQHDVFLTTIFKEGQTLFERAH